MAAGFLRHIAGDRVDVRSAGSTPRDAVNPVAVAAMAELDIDIANAIPARLAEEDVRAADYVITMGCGDACPFIPGRKYLDWVLTDPAGQPLEVVRPIRDEIQARVKALVAEIDAT
jgi:protein-tyrosine-phosphatase